MIAAAAAVRISALSLSKRFSRRESISTSFLLPETKTASAETASFFLIASTKRSFVMIDSSSHARVRMRFLTSSLPVSNNSDMVFFHENRGRPSMISKANNCFTSSLDESVSSIVFTIAAS